MPVTVPSMAVRLPPPGRRLVPACLLLSTLALGASLALTWSPTGPETTQQSGLLSFLQQLLPLLAAALGLLSGALSMLATPASAAPPDVATADATQIAGLQAIVRQLTNVLEEERGQIAAFQEIYGNSTREALVVSRRLALLADVALDAETRLVAGVSQAEDALRHPTASGGRSTDTLQRAQPEITDLIRRGIAEQSRAISSSLDVATARLLSEAEGPVHVFRTAVAGAAGQIKALGDTAAALNRDAIAFDTAGRGLATASTTVVSRLNDAAAHVDAVLTQMPEAAAMLMSAAEQVAQNLTEASEILRADGASFAASGYQMQQSAAVIQQETEAFRASRLDLTHAGATILSQIGGEVARVDAALEQMPAVVEAMIAASERAEHTLADASQILASGGATLAATGQETRDAVAALLQEAGTFKAAGREMSDTGHQTIAAVAQTVETAVARLDAVIADAEVARRGTTGLAELAATLENATATLVDGAYSLDAAGNRVAMAGDKVAERLVADAARSDGILQALPEATADMMAAVEAMRIETSALTAAAQHVSSAGQATTEAVTGVAARVEISAGSLDATGRIISAASQEIAAQIGNLTEIAGYTETQALMLPNIAADVAAAAARLQAVTEAWRPDAMLTILPEAAARIDAAVPRLDQLDGLSMRLETVVAGLEAGHAQEAALATMGVLSADIGEAVRRVEAALTDHEEAWPSVIASMAQIQATTVAAAHAAANDKTLAASEIVADGLPPTLSATLRHFDGVESHTEMLLQQTEALAEAVLSGRAPTLPPLLANRAPGLLAGIEATTERLRSVATALTLASDAKPTLERRRS